MDSIKKYQIIYCDPPWSYSNSGFSYSANKQYPTMDINDICDLPIPHILEENAVLFIWGTWPLLPECLRVIKSWGFTYKTIGFVWVKTSETVNQYILPIARFKEQGGMGFWTMSNTEFCLIAVKGNIRRKNTGVKQIIYNRIKKHSQKPSETKDRIVQLMGDLPRIELFAREKTEGWDVIGNDIDGRDIKESLKTLGEK